MKPWYRTSLFRKLLPGVLSLHPLLPHTTQSVKVLGVPETEAGLAHRQVRCFTDLSILPSIPGSEVMLQAKLMGESIRNGCSDKAPVHSAVVGSKRLLCPWVSALLLKPQSLLVQVPFCILGCSLPHLLLLILQVDMSSSRNSFLIVPHVPYSSPYPQTQN